MSSQSSKTTMKTRETLARRLSALYNRKKQYENPTTHPSYQRYLTTIRWIMDGGADKYADHNDLVNKIFIASDIITNPYAWSTVSNAFLELLLSVDHGWSDYYVSLWMTHRDNPNERNHLLIAHGIHPSVIRQHTARTLPDGWSHMSLRRLAYYKCRRHAILGVMKSIKNDISSFSGR